MVGKITNIVIKGKFNVNIKQTSQGFLGVAENYPIVIEASDMNALAKSLTNALSVYVLNYPKEAQSLMQLSDIAA